ncbi:MAG: hypothetical protein IPM56_03775 [Ignavibacteriales bacterium]|nr:MAG: hypothetical protein IPM56_03775 [Ignavibacteriales bacterium]
MSEWLNECEFVNWYWIPDVGFLKCHIDLPQAGSYLLCLIIMVLISGIKIPDN